MAEQLDNHSMLVLYVAGELPEADRLELDRRFQDDAALRDEMEELRIAHELAMGSLAALDEGRALPQSQLMAAQRHTGRTMRQWQVDRVARKPAPAPSRRMQLGWGIYSAATAAAAILVIGLYVWWDNTYATDTTPGDVVKNTVDPDEEEHLALSIEQGILPPVMHSGEVDRVEQAMTQVQLLGSADRAGRSLWELQ